MIAGSTDKPGKVAFSFGFTSDNEKMEKRKFTFNFFKVRSSDEKPLMDLSIDKDTLSFKLYENK